MNTPKTVHPPRLDRPNDPSDLNEMLQELRILLQGSQMLTAFLVVLPFSANFSDLVRAEKWVYMSTFLCALASLVIFSGPAVHHRIQRPLQDRVAFKNFASRMMIVGLIPLTLALSLMTQLVASEIIDERWATVLAVVTALFIIGVWWVLPFYTRRRRPPAAPPGSAH